MIGRLNQANLHDLNNPVRAGSFSCGLHQRAHILAFMGKSKFAALPNAGFIQAFGP